MSFYTRRDDQLWDWYLEVVLAVDLDELGFPAVGRNGTLLDKTGKDVSLPPYDLVDIGTRTEGA
jgi:hypothetical protein